MGETRPPRWTLRRTFVLFCVLGMTPGVIVGLFFVWLIMFPRSPGEPKRTPEVLGMKYQHVAVRSADGVGLRGWYFAAAKPARTVVIVNGNGDTRGFYIEVAKPLVDAGFAVLLGSLRCHDDSDQVMRSLGLNERLDVAAFVGYAAERAPGGKIGVAGVSVGGVAAMLAARDEPRIRALLTDSSFSSLPELVRVRLADGMGYWGGLYVTPFALATACVLTRAGPWAWSAPRALRAMAPVPHLIIHGTADTYVPPGSPAELKAASAQSELWMIEGGRHGVGREVDMKKYTDRVVAFFAKHLAP